MCTCGHPGTPTFIAVPGYLWCHHPKCTPPLRILLKNTTLILYRFSLTPIVENYVFQKQLYYLPFHHQKFMSPPLLWKQGGCLWLFPLQCRNAVATRLLQKRLGGFHPSCWNSCPELLSCPWTVAVQDSHIKYRAVLGQPNMRKFKIILRQATQRSHETG